MRRGKVTLSWQGTEDSKRQSMSLLLCYSFLFWDNSFALTVFAGKKTTYSVHLTEIHTHTQNVSVEETVQLLYEVTEMLTVLASSGWHQLMAFYFQVISLQWKRNTFLFPDGLQVEETGQNGSKQNERNEKLQLNKKRGRNMARKLPPTLYTFRAVVVELAVCLLWVKDCFVPGWGNI